MSAGWAAHATIDDVLGRMAAIGTTLPDSDGVAAFNRMYAEVTRLVRARVADRTFTAGAFLERLDVHFADLYFQAYDAGAARRPVATVWRPLFAARSRGDILPLQFALAGMNAHIKHDLPCAVVTTCAELGIPPRDGTPQKRDYDAVNSLLAAVEPEVQRWFATGLLGVADRAAGRLDNRLASYSIAAARADAWDTAQLLWALRDRPLLDRVTRAGLARSIATGSRLLLV